MPIGYSGPYSCAHCGSLIMPGRDRTGYNDQYELICGFCARIEEAKLNEIARALGLEDA